MESMHCIEIHGTPLENKISAHKYWGARVRLIQETRDWVAVDKPPHLQIHPSKPADRLTVWNQLRDILAFEIANGGQVSIINRLDRETSGVVLVAKNAAAARRFCRAMELRAFRKEYDAMVWGWPAHDFYEIDAPIARQGDHMTSRVWLKQMVHPAGTPAATTVKVEKRFNRHSSNGSEFSLVRALPLTGRMHQIRVHLAHIGHPVVGDKIYGPSDENYLRFIETGWTEGLERTLLLPRHALHSAQLTLDGEEPLTLKSPLPDDLAGWMNDICLA